MEHPDNHSEFMIWFKDRSEKHFADLELDREVSGFQFQKGTKWKKGLTDQEIFSFQKKLGFNFPKELIEFYKMMNGTDLPGINIYSDRNVPHSYEPIYFSYPEHLPIIIEIINDRLRIKGFTVDYMRKINVPFIFPMTDYYFMVIDNLTNPVFHISTGHKNHDLTRPFVYSNLYADNLQSWLIKDVLRRTDHISDIEEFPDKPRVPNYWSTQNGH
jgi:hypothetical protein